MSDAIEMLREIEWSGVREGPGYGPMDSGPGEKYRACPTCQGLHPENEGRTVFGDKAIGHRAGCELAETLDPSRAVRARQYRELRAELDSSYERIGAEIKVLSERQSALFYQQQAILRVMGELDIP